MDSKIRKSNIEFYRIIVMLLIVAHHYVVNSGLTDVLDNQPFEFRSLFFYIFGMWGKIGINCFVLITGYFMCTSNISVRKFLKLLLEVLFYNVVIYLLFVFAGYEDFSIISLIQKIWIFGKVADGFTTCFLLFYLFIPFLNILVKGLNKKFHMYLIMLSTTIYSVLGSLPGFEIHYSYLTWFFVLYFVASYIRFYNPKRLNKLSNIWGVLVTLVITIGSVISLRFLGIVIGKDIQFFFVMDSNKILALICAVVLFNYFKNLDIPNNKAVNIIASSTFGVYIIHTNSVTMRNWLWNDVVGCVEHYYSGNYMLYAVSWVLAIFVIGTIVDQIRINTIERWFFSLYDKCFVRR